METFPLLILFLSFRLGSKATIAKFRFPMFGKCNGKSKPTFLMLSTLLLKKVSKS